MSGPTPMDSFIAAWTKGAEIVRSAPPAPKGHCVTVNGHDAFVHRAILRRGGLALHRHPTQEFVVLDVASGLLWLELKNRRLAVTIVRRHGKAWAEIVREICTGGTDEASRKRRQHLFDLIFGLRQVYFRGDGEDDGGAAYDVEEPPSNERIGEAALMGLGHGTGFRGPKFILSYRADGAPRAWVRETTSGWARFDVGEPADDRYLAFSAKYRSKRTAMAAESPSARPDDLPPKIVRLPLRYVRADGGAP